MSELAANGIKIGYDSFGLENAEAILLISGLGTQMIRWTDRFCKCLAQFGYQVIRFDNRDAGLSTHFSDCLPPDFREIATALSLGFLPVTPYTLDDMAADAVGLLDGMSIKRAHLVGRSMGGMIAQLLASTYPERVFTLTSIMSSTGNPHLPPTSPDVMAMMMSAAPDPFNDAEQFLAHATAFAKRISGSAYPFDEEAFRSLVLEEVRRSYDPQGVGRQIAAIAATGDIRSRISRVTAPTLVVHGKEDPLVPPAAGADIASCIHGARLMLVDGMGHEMPAALEHTVLEAIIKHVKGAAVGIEM